MTHETKHTPGPWSVYINGQRGANTCRVTAGGYTVASVNCVGDFNSEENAHLIAAAPDLLAALQEVLAYQLIDYNYHGEPTEACRELAAAVAQAETAIAKATGAAHE